MSEKICVVVVTHNRLNLLKECVEALRDQTRKLDEIIVVNNDSQDGTKEWLDEQKDITKIHQENLGGAGGFHNGIKAAYEKGYDWIWCMDDDCIPASDALGMLIKTDLEKEIVYNSLSLNPLNMEPAFYLKECDSNILNTYSKIEGRKTINDAAFFNGTLISQYIVKAIGFPVTELFFRGDEVEYKLRVTQKFKVLTIVNSVIFHPSELFSEFHCFGIKHLYIQMSALKKYFYHRNTVYIYRKYKNRKFIGMFKNAVFDSLCAIIKLKDYQIAVNSMKGFIIGFIFNPPQK